MRIYDLKASFVKHVVKNKYCLEILDANINKGRGYALISIRVGNQDYLIPFRSNMNKENGI